MVINAVSKVLSNHLITIVIPQIKLVIGVWINFKQPLLLISVSKDFALKTCQVTVNKERYAESTHEDCPIKKGAHKLFTSRSCYKFGLNF